MFSATDAVVSDHRYLAALEAEELVASPWQRDGACHGMNSEIFFPFDTADHGPVLAICGRCFVSDICLAFALKTKAQDGVYGETRPEERKPMISAWHARNYIPEPVERRESLSYSKKLDWEKVDAIRGDDESSVEELGEKYGISRSTVKAVRNYRSWTGVRPKVTS